MLNILLREHITILDEMCRDIDEAILNENFKLTAQLLEKRLMLLKKVHEEVNINGNDEAKKEFRLYLSSLKINDEPKMFKLNEEFKIISGLVKKQAKTNQAVSAYSKVKNHK